LRDGLIASVDLLPNGYDEARGVVFYQQALQRLAALPQVQSATFATALPLDISSGSDMAVDIEGYTPQPNEQVGAYYNRVAPGYFETMGIEIVRGRRIDERDVEGRELSVIVNETMARRYWPGGDALGRIVRFGSGPARVVGIARDGKYRRLNEEPRNYLYVPLFQYYRPDVALVVRTAGDPGTAVSAIQAEVKRVDANLPLFDIRTVAEHMQVAVFVPKLAGTLLGLFGGLALVLAIVGLYSVIAFTVAQRTHEIGLRVALGAARGEVVRLILRQGVVLTVVGLAIGLALAAVASRLMADQLVGLGGSDPVSFVSTAIVLLIVALLACAVPARRAASLDPLRALRHE
jgi:predicted permease